MPNPEDTTENTTETKSDVKLPVTDSEVSTEDMTHFWNTLEKMKINPQKFMHWAGNPEEKHPVSNPSHWQQHHHQRLAIIKPP